MSTHWQFSNLYFELRTIIWISDSSIQPCTQEYLLNLKRYIKYNTEALPLPNSLCSFAAILSIRTLKSWIKYNFFFLILKAMDYQGTKIYGAMCKRGGRPRDKRLILQPLFFLNATAVFSCGWEVEMLGKAFSKVAELGGKSGVYDLPRTGSLVNTLFFWLESWRNLPLE